MDATRTAALPGITTTTHILITAPGLILSAQRALSMVATCAARIFLTSLGGYLPNRGIEVCSSNRIIDCNHNEIRGGGDNSSINIYGVNNITVRNCRITNYMAGVFSVPPPFSSSFINIQGNTFTDMQGCGGVCLYPADNIVINGNTFLHTKGPGTDIKLQQVRNANITNNVFTNKASFAGGISLQMSNNILVKANNFTGNSVGIILFLANNNRIHENVFKNIGINSISLIYSDRNVIHKNTITDYWGAGIDLANSKLNNITSNTIKDGTLLSGGAIGLKISSTNNYIASNTLINTYVGVMLSSSGVNTIRNNTILNSRFAGIWLMSKSHRNTIQNNTIKNNTIYGIFIEDSNYEQIDRNYVCLNNFLDFSVNNSLNNSGTDNTCDKPDGWNDTVKKGCSFSCTTGPVNWVDFGDAPDPPYPSLLKNNGARHSVIGIEMLGRNVTPEVDAKTPDADEFDDGVAFPVFTSLTNTIINVTVTVSDRKSPRYNTSLFLSGWFDWDADGTWSSNEQSFNLTLFPNTFSSNIETIPVTISTPLIKNDTVWARIRLSYRAPTGVTGLAIGGEVEDYCVNVSRRPSLTISGKPKLSQTINFSLSSPTDPGKPYALALALGSKPGIPLGNNRIIPLNPDAVFFLSLQLPHTLGLNNSLGTLDSSGNGLVQWNIPNIPQIAGLTVWAAFVTVDSQAPSGIASISPAVPVRLVA